MKQVVIVGIGNTLLGDEGVGVHVLNKLRSARLPKGVELVEGGVGGLALLDNVKGFDWAIFIDSLAGDTPGRIHRLTGNDIDTKVKTSLHPTSAHDVGLPEMIKIGKSVYPDEMPKKIIIYGIEITELKMYSAELSREIRETVDKVAELILQDLGIIRK